MCRTPAATAASTNALVLGDPVERLGAGDHEQRVHTGQRRPARRTVVVAGRHHVGAGQVGGPGGVADDQPLPVAGGREQSRHPAAEPTRRAGDREIRHVTDTATVAGNRAAAAIVPST